MGNGASITAELSDLPFVKLARTNLIVWSRKAAAEPKSWINGENSKESVSTAQLVFRPSFGSGVPLYHRPRQKAVLDVSRFHWITMKLCFYPDIKIRNNTQSFE